MKVTGKTLGNIEKLVGKAVDLREVAKQSADAKRSGKGLGVAAGPEDLRLSEGARGIKKFTRMAAGLPTEGEKKVEGIRSAIARGEYRVDSRKVAGKIIEEAVLSAAAVRSKR